MLENQYQQLISWKIKYDQQSIICNESFLQAPQRSGHSSQAHTHGARGGRNSNGSITPLSRARSPVWPAHKTFSCFAYRHASGSHSSGSWSVQLRSSNLFCVAVRCRHYGSGQIDAVRLPDGAELVGVRSCGVRRHWQRCW